MIALAPRWPGLAIVIALHGAALWGLWQHRLLPTPAALEPLFVRFIAPPAPAIREQTPRPPARPQPEVKSQPQQLLAAMPTATPQVPAAPAPPPPAATPEAPRMALPAGPVALGSELAVACAERAAPAYPAASRRRGETGSVVLRVELDEQGAVAEAWIETASGHERLDHAALVAVKTWRCTPPRRNGEAVRAIARQAFHFLLQGS
ncbi:MAG: energy transducer TonB [Rhodocyclales bacterium]|nr:energy transducer TonB [Rhodocyclales bacterium]